MTLVPISPFSGMGPEFNRAAAEKVYGQLMKMDAESAEVYGRMLVGAVVQTDLIVHGEQIAKAAAELLEHRTQVIRKQLIRTSIAKARAGADNSVELQLLVELQKNFVGDLFSNVFRRDRAEHQRRDPQGQFAVMHQPLDRYSQVEVIPGRFADKLGTVTPEQVKSANLNSAQLANLQHDYLQVRRMLQPYADLPARSGIVTFHYDGGDTDWTFLKDGSVPVIGVGGAEHGIDPTKKLKAISLDVAPDTDAKGGIFATFNALGLPKLGAILGHSTDKGVLNRGSLNNFDEAWNKKVASDQFMPSNRVFRRLDAGSQLIEDSLGGAATPQVKMALSVARHVGSVGGKAHQIIAPTLDRAAYRYRGTTRSVDERLKTAVDTTELEVSQRGGDAAQLRAAGKEAEQGARGKLVAERRLYERSRKQLFAERDSDDARVQAGSISQKDYGKRVEARRKDLEASERRLQGAQKQFESAVDQSRIRHEQGDQLHQNALVDAMRRGYPTARDEWKPSPVLDYFIGRVPKPELASLQLKSGVVPPSEGVILSGDGRIKAQTVGYGDDHYLPFTLKNLAGLKGGYYIRTRTFGGPTTEDIHTALVTGAKGLTVVSNNGVFTLDFEHDLKGGRRFNDKAARMVARYGHLLDAVESGYVQGGEISPARKRELHAKANKLSLGDPAEAIRQYTALESRELKDPQLSDQEKQEIAVNFLNAQFDRSQLGDVPTAGRRPGVVRPARSSGLTLDDMAAWVGNKAAQREYAEYQRQHPEHAGLPPAIDLAQLGRTKTDQLLATQDPAGAIAAYLGAETGLKQAIDRGQQEHRKAMLPLKLDGHGYHVALQALKEQFPYYIHDVNFERLVDGVDRDDSGYVKPKFNRPEGALAGYFDPSVGGTTKISADQIRHQNAPILQGKLTEEQLGNPPKAETQAPTAAGMSSPRQGGVNIQGMGGVSTPQMAGVGDALGMRRRADKAMLDYLLELRDQTMNEHAKGMADAKGRPVRDLAANGAQLPDYMSALLSHDKAATLNLFRANPDAMHEYMTKFVTWVDNNNVYDLDQTILDAFTNQGKPAQVVKLNSENLVPALAEPNKDWDFRDLDDGAAYMKAASPSKQEVLEAYARNGAIQALVKENLLPAHPGDRDALKSDTAKLSGELATAKQRWVEWDAEGIPPAPTMKPVDINMRAFGVSAARQLGRRYQEAVGRETQIQAGQNAKPDEEIVEHEHNVVELNPDGSIKAIAQSKGPDVSNALGVNFDDILNRFRPQQQQ